MKRVGQVGVIHATAADRPSGDRCVCADNTRCRGGTVHALL